MHSTKCQTKEETKKGNPKSTIRAYDVISVLGPSPKVTDSKGYSLCPLCKPPRPPGKPRYYIKLAAHLNAKHSHDKTTEELLDALRIAEETKIFSSTVDTFSASSSSSSS